MKGGPEHDEVGADAPPSLMKGGPVHDGVGVDGLASHSVLSRDLIAGPGAGRITCIEDGSRDQVPG